MSGLVEYGGAIAVGIALLVARRSLSLPALAGVAIDEAIEGLVLGIAIAIARARAFWRAGRVGAPFAFRRPGGGRRHFD